MLKEQTTQMPRIGVEFANCSASDVFLFYLLELEFYYLLYFGVSTLCNWSRSILPPLLLPWFGFKCFGKKSGGVGGCCLNN